jgi:hypothetical protein
LLRNKQQRTNKEQQDHINHINRRKKIIKKRMKKNEKRKELNTSIENKHKIFPHNKRKKTMKKQTRGAHTARLHILG